MLKLVAVGAVIFCSALCAAKVTPQPLSDPMPQESDILQQWATFKLDHNKKYSSVAEEQERFGIFSQNLLEIFEFNQQSSKSYKMGMNSFGDQTHEEMAVMNGARLPKDYVASNTTSSLVALDDVPESKDWRDDGAINPVKNQGSCGSCYAFAANAALEAHTFIKTQSLPDLSEQNIVDCTKKRPYNNGGCQGGWMQPSWKYVQDNKGQNSNKVYPYKAKEGSCRYQKTKIAATAAGSTAIEQGNEEELLKVVGTTGPVAVAIAVPKSWQRYKEGVYDDDCPAKIEHAVVVVGYGNEDGKDYWIVRNSWGTGWGDQGYIKMARGKNLCGIADYASYPNV